MKDVIKTFFIVMLSSGLFSLSATARAALDVFACEPEWASLAQQLGGDRVTVFSATTAFQDPHHIEARPSLIAKLRRAELLICSGAELEAGWLPQLQRQAANAQVLSAQPGYFEAAMQVERLDIATELDRSKGDVHASGNPHVHLDPRRVLKISQALTKRLIQLDSSGQDYYLQRSQQFEQRWQQSMQQWQTKAAALKGARIVVHHRDWVYLFDWLGIEVAGVLEPRPGLPVTVGHLAALSQAIKKAPAAMIVHSVYQSPKAAQRFSQLTSIPVVELPYTVGGDEQVIDLFSLFDITLQKLTGAVR